MNFKKLFQGLFFLLLLYPASLFAQISDSSLIQFSGVVVTADSLTPIPYVNIKIRETSRNVVSDSKGFFSIKANKKNNITFSWGVL